MRNFRRRIVVGGLFFVLIGIFVRLHHQPYHAAAFDHSVLQVQTAVRAGEFAPGELEIHYSKHGYQFGEITQEQYLQDAQALLNAVPGDDVFEKVRPNGDVEHFRASTGEFAVMTKWGRIRTYYKASYGYWLRH